PTPPPPTRPNFCATRSWAPCTKSRASPRTSSWPTATPASAATGPFPKEVTVGHQPLPTSPELLDAVCRSAAKLMSASAGPVRRMRLQAGEVAVEVEWPDPVPVAAAAGPSVPAPSTVDSDAGLHHVCSPIIGTFYHAPEPGAEPFV